MNIDYVIKIGGSILYDKEKTKRLLEVLANSRCRNIVYMIGSGYLGEVYKTWADDSNMSFENSSICWSNIQSINANVIATINPKFVVCESIEKIEDCIKVRKRPIADARAFHEVFKDLNWQTTDVRAAKLCKKLGCKNLVIITDVNGIYTTDPKKSQISQKINRINAKELMKMGRTSVDRGLAEKLIEYGITSYVVGIDSLLQQREFDEKKDLKKGTVIEYE